MQLAEKVDLQFYRAHTEEWRISALSLLR